MTDLALVKRLRNPTPYRSDLERETQIEAADAIEAMHAALWLIAEMGNKTLIAPSMGECCDHAHQVGANKAFEQAADIARDAIRKVQP